MLGKGEYGAVVLTNVLGLQFAHKILKADEAAEREVRVLITLRSHPNIVSYYGHWKVGEDEMQIRTGYEGHRTLLQEVQTRGPQTEEWARIVLAGVLAALDYAHREKGIVHRDIKAENIVLRDDGMTACVCDWGMATEWSADTKIYELCGSPHYCPPEAFRNEGYYGPEFDVWSFGVLLYVVSHGYFPFNGSTRSTLARRVGKMKPEFAPAASPALRALLSSIFVPASTPRPTVAQILASEWMQTRPASPSLREQSRSTFKHDSLALYRRIAIDDTSIASSMQLLRNLPSELQAVECSSSAPISEAEQSTHRREPPSHGPRLTRMPSLSSRVSSRTRLIPQPDSPRHSPLSPRVAEETERALGGSDTAVESRRMKASSSPHLPKDQVLWVSAPEASTGDAPTSLAVPSASTGSHH